MKPSDILNLCGIAYGYQLLHWVLQLFFCVGAWWVSPTVIIPNVSFSGIYCTNHCRCTTPCRWGGPRARARRGPAAGKRRGRGLSTGTGSSRLRSTSCLIFKYLSNPQFLPLLPVPVHPHRCLTCPTRPASRPVRISIPLDA